MAVPSEITVRGRLPSSTAPIDKFNPSRKSYLAMIAKKRMMILTPKVETTLVSRVKTVQYTA